MKNSLCILSTEDLLSVFYERKQVTVDDLVTEFKLSRKFIIGKLRRMQCDKKIHVVNSGASNEFIRTVWQLGERNSEDDYEPVVQVTTKHWKSEPFQVTMLEQLLFAKPEPKGVQLCLI